MIVNCSHYLGISSSISSTCFTEGCLWLICIFKMQRSRKRSIGGNICHFDSLFYFVTLFHIFFNSAKPILNLVSYMNTLKMHNHSDHSMSIILYLKFMIYTGLVATKPSTLLIPFQLIIKIFSHHDSSPEWGCTIKSCYHIFG